MSSLTSNRWRGMYAVCWLTVIVTSVVSLARADDGAKGPPAEKASKTVSGELGSVFNRTFSLFTERESVQMLSAVVGGSQMGPGDGWFKSSLNRYGWKWLAARHHVEADGTISADKFLGDKVVFERLDRNRDGSIKADDFDWSSDSPFVRQMSSTGPWFRGIDSSSNGRLTREEWDQYFERAAGEKGFVTPEDLRAILFPPPPKGAANDGPSVSILLKGLVTGELGSLLEGPGLNTLAPDFELKTQDGTRTIRLSSYREKKPVVLIFGSFT